MKINPAKNIIFDLGGVIINLNQDLTYKAFHNLFPSNFNTILNQLETTNWLERYELGEFSSKDFLNWFKQFDSKVTDIQLTNAWNSILLDIPKARIDLITRLSKTYNVYLLSNTNQIHYQFIVDYVKTNFENLDFNSLFKKMYLSHEIKLRKPNKSIFEYVLNDSKLTATETVFIDDSEEHVTSAKQLGIDAYHLNLKEKHTLIHLFNEH